MRIYKNQAYIQRRATIGKWLFWIALGVLVAGMFTSFRFPEYTFLPLAALVIGFLMAQVGAFYLNRFVRPDRADVSLPAALKGFSHHYALYHYLSPAAHVLLAPEACYVFAVKFQDGKITVKDGRAYEPVTLGRILTFFGRESAGDLAREAQSEADKLARHIARLLPDAQVTVTPVVVFVHPNAQLDVQSSSVAVVHAKQLKDWLRGPGKAKGLTLQTREQLAQVLSGKHTAEQDEA